MSGRPRRRSPRAAAPLRAAIAPLVERLESRRMLAINPVATQPTGPLTGKIVYTSGGHGWDWADSPLNRWATDRGDLNEMIEDFGNQDQLTFFADYLMRAGATVVPLRPIGHQTSEVVLDNDSAGVTRTGSWANSTDPALAPRYYDEDYGTPVGAGTDSVRYHNAGANSAAETATATYTPNIPSAGFYPVYTWAAHGASRTSQLYKVNHSGGQMQVRIDHSKVGNGWVYLGTYHFNAGTSAANGSVQISNHALAGTVDKVVIADAIRFGNGMGDVKNGPNGIAHSSGTISGYPRQDENALHWLWRGVGLGSDSNASIIGTSNVSAPTLMAEAMNLAPFGTSVYIGFHSNATTGDPATATARGARGLMTTSASLRTPHQADLALYTGRQINQDMQALNGAFEHNWTPGSDHTGNNLNFGEIDEGPSAEMDMTIIEVAFHDNVQDAELMRDPKVRDQIGRSTYEAVLEYFDNWGGLNAPVTVPSAPVNPRALSNASGEVTLNWAAGPTGVRGAAATGYRVYVSMNGYGFDGGTLFNGAATTTGTVTGLAPGVPHYFKIVAVNAGGESLSTEVVAAVPSGGSKHVLIVNGFDRFDSSGNVRYANAFASGGLTDRVFARFNNSFDYAVQVASAIQAVKPGMHVASASNEAVVNGSVNLADYDTVVWIGGEESTVNDTFNATEQTKVEQFIAGGGNLFVSGAEIGWDLDQLNNGRAFYENTFKANYVNDDAGTYNVVGTSSPAGGGPFLGLSFSFDNGSQFYNADFPDVIAAQSGASAVLNYSGGTGGAAGIAVPASAATGRGGVVYFAFPFETITTAAARQQVLNAVFGYLGTTAAPTPAVPDLLASSDTGSSDTDNRTRLNNLNGNVLQFSVGNTIPGARVSIYLGAEELGWAIATSSTTVVTTDGDFLLSNGTRFITAKQTITEIGTSAASPVLNVTVDATAPAKPGNGTLTARYNSITYDWPDNAESDRHGYNIYRSTTFGGGGPYTKLNASPLLSSIYKDTAVTQGQSYNYVVTCVDTAGNESVFSDEGSAIPTDSSPAPTSLVLHSDTGRDTTDKRTKTNNEPNNVFRSVRINVGGTLEDAVVRVYANGQFLGSAVAGASDPTTVFSSSSYVLPDGNVTITATQQLPGTNESGAGPVSLTIFVDADAPTATLATQTPTGGAATFDFTVDYADALSGIDAWSVNGNNLTVTGPNGYTAAADYLSFDGTTATYRVAAPGGAWDAADGGTYTVSMNHGFVTDQVDNNVPVGPIGTFAFSGPPFAYVTGDDLHVEFSAGGGTVSFARNGASFDVTRGAQTLSFPVAAVDDIVFHGTSGADLLEFNATLEPGSAIDFQRAGGLDAVSVLGGRLVLPGAADDANARLAVTVAAGASIRLDGNFHLRDLNVYGSVEAAGDVLATSGLVVAASGRLDLIRCDLLYDYSGPTPIGTRGSAGYDGITALIARGFGEDAAWGGNGIASSTAAARAPITTLGVAEAADLFGLANAETAAFGVETVDATTVIVRYTYFGDANLDGAVDGGDYAYIDAYVGSTFSDVSYLRGDFNFDGYIDGGDYAYIDVNVGNDDEVL